MQHFMTACPGHHFSYEPLKCDRYLGKGIVCREEFVSSYERQKHRESCFWACEEVGCEEQKGQTRKRDIDKHIRKHAVQKEKILNRSQFLLEP